MELDRTGIIDRLKSGITTIDNFNYDKLTAPPLSTLLTQYDIDRLYNIATSLRYSGNVRKKYKAIDEILTARDFMKLSAGTNRLCYKFRHDDSFVIKVAYDSVAIQDSPAEFRNQYILKPFCTKVFEVDPCGVVGSFERVDPITSREEFISVADDVYYLIDSWLLSNGHIMADIGTKYFMNYGLRRGFGVVIIDFPYLYEIDGNKIFCTSPDSKSDTGLCGGVIDFDPGRNELYCKKCGTRYRVKEISKNVEEGKILIKGNNKGGNKKMKVKITVGGHDLTERDDRIDGFRPEARKVAAPVNKGRVAVKRVPREARNSSNGSTTAQTNDTKTKVVTAHGVRSNNSQQDNKYTKPTGKVSVQRNQQAVKPSRPLPERGEQKPVQSDPADSRGKTVVATEKNDNYTCIAANTTITESEKQYIMQDNPIPVAEEQSSGGMDDCNMEKLEEAQKAESFYKAEAEKFKKLAESTNAELEQTKHDLEATEVINESLKESFESLKGQYNSLMEINGANENTIKSQADIINQYMNDMSKATNDIDTLNEENAKLREVLENTKEPEEPEVDTNKFVPVSVHEAEISEMGLKISEMENTVQKISEDLYDFCDFSLRVNEYLLKPSMKSEQDFIPEQFEGMSVVDGSICLLSDLRKLDDGEDDMYVLALRYGNDYLSTSDGKFVIAATIAGFPISALVVDGFENIMGKELCDKYFADEEVDEEENTEKAEEVESESEPEEVEAKESEEAAEVLEHAEGEVITDDGNGDAEVDNSREN